MRIFVSIASYRDPQLSDTVYSLFANATLPCRVVVGIYNQLDTVDMMRTNKVSTVSNHRLSWKLFPAALKRVARANTHVEEVDHLSAGGPLYARQALISTFDEQIKSCDIFFQIDSHIDFVAGWDVLVIDALFQTPDWSRSVLSHYPPSKQQMISGDNRVPQMSVAIPCTRYPEITTFKARLVEAPSTPVQSIGLAAGCLAFHTSLIPLYPTERFDGLFQGEEFLLAQTFKMNSVKTYAFPRVVCTHEYNRTGFMIWEDHTNFLQREAKAVKRLTKYLKSMTD